MIVADAGPAQTPLVGDTVTLGQLHLLRRIVETLVIPDAVL